MSTDVYIAIGTCVGGIAALMTLGWHTLKYLIRKETQEFEQRILERARDHIEARFESLQNAMQEQQKMDSINDRFEQLWSEL